MLYSYITCGIGAMCTVFLKFKKINVFNMIVKRIRKDWAMNNSLSQCTPGLSSVLDPEGGAEGAHP